MQSRTPMISYRKLPSRLQHLVNGHLSFETKVLLRTTSKLFSSLSADRFLLPGHYRFVRVQMDEPHVTSTGVSFIVFDDPDLREDRHEWLAIRINTYCPDRLYSISCQHLKMPIGHLQGDCHWVSAFQSTVSIDMGRCHRILDKLTRVLRRHPVALLRAFAPAPVAALGEMSFFQRSYISIDANRIFITNWVFRDGYLRLEEFVPNGLQLYQASFGPNRLHAPSDYLRICVDAFEKLIDVPFLRFNQIYDTKADCLESLAIIERLIHYIVKNPSSGHQKRIVSFRTFTRSLDARPQEDRADYQLEMDVMLNRLIDTFDQSPPSHPLQLYVDEGHTVDVPKRGWEAAKETGIHIIIVQNYSIERSEQLLHRSPWPARHIATEPMIGPREELQLRWITSVNRNPPDV